MFPIALPGGVTPKHEVEGGEANSRHVREAHEDTESQSSLNGVSPLTDLGFLTFDHRSIIIPAHLSCVHTSCRMSQDDVTVIRAQGASSTSGSQTPAGSLGTIAVDMDDVLWCVFG